MTYNVPIISATQTTRTGYMSSDVGLEDTSESFGLPATADFMFALISNEDLEELSQMKVKQLKNRYNDPAINRSFIVGVDRAKMKLYDVENVAQNIVDKGTQVENNDKGFTKFRKKLLVRKLERLRLQNEQLRDSGEYWYKKCKDTLTDLLD